MDVSKYKTIEQMAKVDCEQLKKIAPTKDDIHEWAAHKWKLLSNISPSELLQDRYVICGLCSLHLYKDQCNDCILATAGQQCLKPTSLYQKCQRATRGYRITRQDKFLQRYRAAARGIYEILKKAHSTDDV